MFVGPFIIQVLYQKICIILLIYLTFKSFLIFVMSIITYCKSRRIIRRAEELKQNRILGEEELENFNPEVYHAFIIPNYKEDEEMLAETMERIASHKGARQRYMVFLAMEAHEENSDLKA